MKLELIRAANGHVDQLEMKTDGKVFKGEKLTALQLDPTKYENGFYNLKLTAKLTSGTEVPTDLWVEIAAKPKQKEIHLPGASAPRGIAIDAVAGLLAS